MMKPILFALAAALPATALASAALPQVSQSSSAGNTLPPPIISPQVAPNTEAAKGEVEKMAAPTPSNSKTVTGGNSKVGDGNLKTTNSSDNNSPLKPVGGNWNFAQNQLWMNVATKEAPKLDAFDNVSGAGGFSTCHVSKKGC